MGLMIVRDEQGRINRMYICKMEGIRITDGFSYLGARKYLQEFGDVMGLENPSAEVILRKDLDDLL